MDTYLGCFPMSAIVNRAAMIVGMQLPLPDSAFNSFGYRLRGRITGSHGNPVFHFLKRLHTLFRSGYTILRSHQQRTRVCISLHSCQHVLFSGFLRSSHPRGCEIYFMFVIYVLGQFGLMAIKNDALLSDIMLWKSFLDREAPYALRDRAA